MQLLGRALVAEGHTVRVIGIYHHSCKELEYENDHGVQVWRLRRSRFRFGWIWARYQVFRTISKWSRAHEIDLIEIADYAGAAAKWPKLRVPVIARLHGSATYYAAELRYGLKKIDYWLENASLARADFVCSVSHYAAKQTQKAFDARLESIEVLYNFVEAISNPSHQQRSSDKVVYSGTLTRKKGILSLLKAWKIVLGSCKHATLHVYGKDRLSDSDRQLVTAVCNELNQELAGAISFHGHVTRQVVLDALTSARVGVFPSYAESFGLGPAESMAVACPTIYTERGCGGELVRHQRDGLLVDPDQPEKIAEAILELLRDDQLADRLGWAGHQRIVDNFSLAVLLPLNLAFYRKCIKMGPTASVSSAK